MKWLNKYTDTITKAQDGKNVENQNIELSHDIVNNKTNLSKNFFNNWTESPQYIKMLNSSSLGKELENINNTRKNNLKTTESVYVDKENGQTAGESNNKTGKINIYPKGILLNGVVTHEMSHSTDRPEKGMTKRAIPKKDIEKIKDYSQLQDFKLEDLAQKFNNKNEAKNWQKYISKPTETRARLNDIRMSSKQNNLYDPFTEEVTPEIYEKLKNYQFESEKNSSYDALKQLKDVYSDEQIKNMLNTISDNNNSSEIQQFQKGGTIKKPIYVDSKNDPRYKAYQDSLSLYKKSKKDIENYKNNIGYSEIMSRPIVANIKNKPINTFYGEGLKIPIYKKPNQSVLIKPREKLKNIPILTPQEIQTEEQKFNTELLQIRQVTQQPKHYNVTDKVNQNFGGSETNYKWYPSDGQPLKELSQEKYEDGTPYNERKMIPRFQDGGSVSWNNQLKKVRQEKANKPLPKLSVADLIAEKKLRDQNIGRQLPPQIQKDNTRVNINNKPELISKVARNKTNKEIAEERKYIREQDAKSPVNTDFFNPESHTRENWAIGSKGLESKFRVSDEPNFFDDYINPANMVGVMGASLGSAPLRAQQEDSYMPYITSIGAPLAVGALAGIGTNSTGQFVNNLANPLAGTGDELINLGSVIKNKIYQKPLLIANDLEKQIVKNTRSIGSQIANNNVNNVNVLRTIERKAEFLSDDSFYRLTGFRKADIPEKIKELENSVINKKEIENLTSSINPHNDNANNELRAILDEIHLDIGPTTPYREIQNPPDLDAFLQRRNNSQNLNNVLISSNKRKKESIGSALLKELSEKIENYNGINYIKKTPIGNPKELNHYLVAGEGVNPVTEMKKSIDLVKNSNKGDSFIAAHSLSTDSKIAELAQINNLTKQGLIDVNFHGFNNTNNLGFSQQAGLPIELNLKEINNTIKNINSSRKSNLIPYAKLKNEQLLYPNLSITRKKNGGIIEDNKGQWAHPGEITKINSNNITMKNVNQKLLGISDTGDMQLMYPEQEYKFKGKNVTEFPIGKNGKTINKNWLDNY